MIFVSTRVHIRTFCSFCGLLQSKAKRCSIKNVVNVAICRGNTFIIAMPRRFISLIFSSSSGFFFPFVYPLFILCQCTVGMASSSRHCTAVVFCAIVFVCYRCLVFIQSLHSIWIYWSWRCKKTTSSLIHTLDSLYSAHIASNWQQPKKIDVYFCT